MIAPDPVLIDDPDDPRIEPYRAIRERDLVGRQGRFVVEGDVTLRVMLSPGSRFRLESVLLTPSRLAALEPLLASHPAPPAILTATKATMSAIAGFPIHRGVLAIGLRGPELAADALVPPPPSPAVVVGLLGLTNHDNVGAIFRNAAAFGADGLLLDEQTCDPLYRKAIRVSAGTALTLPFARAAAADILAFADRHGLAPLALSPHDGDDIAEIDLPSRVLLLLGSEGPGLPSDILGRARRLRIGMANGVDSLNVATAGAIALHHARLSRRRAL